MEHILLIIKVSEDLMHANDTATRLKIGYCRVLFFIMMRVNASAILRLLTCVNQFA